MRSRALSGLGFEPQGWSCGPGHGNAEPLLRVARGAQSCSAQRAECLCVPVHEPRPLPCSSQHLHSDSRGHACPVHALRLGCVHGKEEARKSKPNIHLEAGLCAWKGGRQHPHYKGAPKQLRSRSQASAGLAA